MPTIHPGFKDLTMNLENFKLRFFYILQFIVEKSEKNLSKELLEAR